MKTIVEALQDLYVAMGGELKDVSGLSLNPDVIESIATLVQSGAMNDLPAVTVADDGDILTVVNGAWSKADPPTGESNIVYVPINVDRSGGDPVVSCEVSVDTILSYFNAGKIVYLKEVYSAESGNYMLYRPTDIEPGDKVIQWFVIEYSPLLIGNISVNGSTWEYSGYALQQAQS